MYKVTIPMRLPGLNEYIEACKIQKGRWNKGNQMKQDTQAEMVYYLRKLPRFEKPVRIRFIWVSGKRRQARFRQYKFCKEICFRRNATSRKIKK